MIWTYPDFSQLHILNVHPTHVVSERLGVSVIATSSLILSSLLKFVFRPLYHHLSLPAFIMTIAGFFLLICIVKVAMEVEHYE